MSNKWARLNPALLDSLRKPDVWVAVVFCAYVWICGLIPLGQMPTDSFSEQNSFRIARLIEQGSHKYGIVDYTHYPGGPIYLIVFLRKIGISEVSGLRLLPLSVSVVCFSFMLYAMLLNAGSLPLKLWAVFSCLSLYHQPGICLWQGDLHEHSYTMAILFLLAAISSLFRRIYPSLFILGFVSGWIGYTFAPAQVITVFVVRFLFYSRYAENSPSKVLIRAFADAAAIASGILSAIALHLVQNALYFGSVGEAFRDLLGSAAGRMNLDLARDISPGYAAHLRTEWHPPQWSSRAPGRLELVSGLWRHFLESGWTSRPLLLYALVMGLGIWAWKYTSMLLQVHHRICLNRMQVLELLVVGAGAVLAPISWMILMTNHTAVHVHLLPRLFFAGYVLLAMSSILLCRRRFLNLR